MLIKTLLSENNRGLIKRLCSEHFANNLKLLGLAFGGMVIDAFSTGALTYVIQRVIDDVIVNLNYLILVQIAVLAVLISIMKGIGNFVKDLSLAKLGQKIVTDLQLGCFRALMYADLELFHSSKTGDLVFHLTNDIVVLRNMIATSLTNIGKDFVTVIFLVLLAFYKDYKLAFVGFIGFPLVLVPILHISFRVRRFANKAQSEMGTWSAFLIQIFQGMRLVKAYNMENLEINSATDIAESIQKIVVHSAKTKALVHPIMEVLIGCATAAVVFMGGIYVINGHQSAGTLLSFVGALLLAYRPIKNLTQLNNNIQEGLVSAKRIYSLADVKPTILDKINAKKLVVKKSTIKFENVGFKYSNGYQALLDISFEVDSGTKVALVGTSGAGKSSLMNLIPRFYDCTSGQILIDGFNIKDVTLASLRSSMALVSQESILFNDSIKANIEYGHPECTFDKIISAAKMAAASDFINKLPNGFDTIVGENGIALSGGQRQRIAIARALIKNAPILLLDEATSSLDHESERQVQEAIKNLMRGRTTLVIAHRLSTIIDADKIIVLNNGRIAECGKHKELLKLNGIYSSLYRSQSFL